MAQDFYAAFGLGDDELRINTINADGIALAAIQGLNKKLESKIRRLESALDTKAQRITELENRLSALEAALEGD
jgi:trimeric autotransporter adhesin